MQQKGKITSSGNNSDSVEAKIKQKSLPHTTYHGSSLDYCFLTTELLTLFKKTEGLEKK